MKRLLSNLLLSSALFWGVPAVHADELVETEVVDVITDYCHMKFAPMDEATLFWVRPELNATTEQSIDFYGPCDYDPTGPVEVRTQRAILLRELYGDSSND
jgi:hypothetical protein